MTDAAAVLGEVELQRYRNPFRVPFLRGALAVCVAAILGLLTYSALINLLQANLANAVARSDVLSRHLAEAVLYPNSVATEVDDLASVTWIRAAKLAPADASLSSVLENDRLQLLFAAIRYGMVCGSDNAGNGVQGQIEPLHLATVDRISRLGGFLGGRNCSDKSGNGPSDLARETIVRAVAGLTEFGPGQSCSSLATVVSFDGKALGCGASFFPSKAVSGTALFKKVLDAHAAYDLAEEPEAKEPTQSDVLDDKNLKAFEAHRGLYGLSRVAAGDAGSRQTEDGGLRALESFAVWMISAIDSDTNVSAARRYLSAARGIEQALIWTLFLITVGLLAERQMRFREHRRRIAGATALLTQAADDSPRPAAKAMSKASDIELARKDEALWAASRLTKVSGGQSAEAPGAELVAAAQADLRSLSLYGLTDEAVDKTADDLKAKIDSSRVVVGWCIATLPALGFLGTVHGILDALGGVGGLSQGDAAARLSALISVSGALGLAFATTLLALSFMIALSFWDVRQQRSERAAIERFSDFLTKRVLA